jgi:CubicO group peptidase (beta-lactamase class C family)
MTITPPDFADAHALLEAQVALRRLPGVSVLVARQGEIIDAFCTGWADIEQGVPLRPDHLHRAFSNTKLMTSVLVLRLVDEGFFALDDPVKAWLPGFAHTRVLRPGATTLDDTEPLARDITIRHLLSHGAGLSHGVFDPGTKIYEAYHAAGLRLPDSTMALIGERIPALPLLYQPGEGWEYSMAPDVLARLVEIVTGQGFAQALKQRLLEPLGMVDTGYTLRPDQVDRLASLYAGNIADPLQSGLERQSQLPWPQAFLKPVARQGGASGLLTTQADMLALLLALMPGPRAFLKPATLRAMFEDQLRPDVCVRFRDFGPMPAFGHGLSGALLRRPFEGLPQALPGELQWGGLAGTHWWLSPADGVAGVLMTQRHFGWWNPFWWDYRQCVDATLRRTAVQA